MQRVACLPDSLAALFMAPLSFPRFLGVHWQGAGQKLTGEVFGGAGLLHKGLKLVDALEETAQS